MTTSGSTTAGEFLRVTLARSKKYCIMQVVHKTAANFDPKTEYIRIQPYLLYCLRPVENYLKSKNVAFLE